MKRTFSIILLLGLLLCACGTQTSTPTESAPVSTTRPTTVSPSELFTETTPPAETDYIDITLNDNSATCSQKGVEISGNTVTITARGSYRLSGELNGMVIVDTTSKDDITLMLSDAKIVSESSAALYVKQANAVTLLLEGENRLANGGSFVAIDESNIDAALFAKDPLYFNGTGSLTVDSPAGHGIVGKDDLRFSSGHYTLQADRHGITSNNSICVANGNFNLTTGKDGFHAENPNGNASDFIYLGNGNFTIASTGDAISAGSYMQIDDGNYNFVTGGGSVNAPTHAGQFGGAFPGGFSDQEDTGSAKGLKVKGNLTVFGGNFVFDCADDAIHCDAAVLLSGGEWNIASGDDAIHAGGQLRIDDGKLTVSKSYEGLEAQCIDINGGEIDLTTSDDGLNAAGGNDDSGTGGFGRNDIFANDTAAYVKITGGILRVNAGGDGVDSNGSIFVSGGETYVSGPTNGGNGSLDYGGEATITGGIFVAAGSSGMAAGFGYNSTQGALLVSYSSQPADSDVVLTDSEGRELFRWQTVKQSSSIVLSCPGMVQGQTYHLTVGAITGDISLTEIVYGYSNGMGGPGGGGPGGGGNPPDGGGRPGGGRPH